MKKYKDYKIDELRNLCIERGLDNSGTKNNLVSRLLKEDNTKHKTPEIFTQPLVVEQNVKQVKAIPSFNCNFYLQIKSANLSNYFNFGYFYPLALEESEIYKNENRVRDILSTFEDYVIVGKTPFNQFEDTDALIELVLDNINVTQYENSGLFYIADPIPVSRVKAIFFKSNTVKTTFISSIKTFPDSFIPSSICEVNENEAVEKIDFEKIKLPKNQGLFEWTNKLELFDRTLGLFAFIKNVGIFYAEKENKFENYSFGFFSSLNLINPIKQLSAYKENLFLKPLFHYRTLEINNAQRVIFKSAIERVYADKTFDIKTAIEILKTSISNEYSKNGELLDIKELVDLFMQLDKLTISYKTLLLKEVLRKNIPAFLPTLALLFLSKFPNKSRQNTDKQAVRNSFIDDEFGFPLNVAEYILGFLGLYYGYKNMIKEDTNLKFSDKNFELLAAKTQSIKFKLESYLDRFIIESAFQFSVKKTVLNDAYDFLNWSNEKRERTPVLIPSSAEYDYSDKSINILGEQILSIQRQDKIEKIFDKISNQYSDKIESASYLNTFLIKYLHIDKWHTIDMLKKNKGNYPLDELEKVIELDKQNKKK